MTDIEALERRITRAARVVRRRGGKLRALENHLATLLRPRLIEYLEKTKGASRDDAEDATHDALLQLPRVLEKYDTSKEFAPLMYTVATRRLHDGGRKASPTAMDSTDPVMINQPCGGLDVPEEVIKQETYGRVKRQLPRCWRKLELEQRMLLLLSWKQLPEQPMLLTNDLGTFAALWAQTRTAEELTILLGLPPDKLGSIRGKLFRARRDLLKCLGEL
jgi:DNA-directed RNA polymerase specialized sigma24 family protein